MAVPVRADAARLTPVEFTSAEHAAAFIGAHCLDDGPVGQVGLEIEAHCFDLDDPLRRPGWDELSEA
nr:hypothetical protein [Streptomyces sp. DSM 41633]